MIAVALIVLGILAIWGWVYWTTPEPADVIMVVAIVAIAMALLPVFGLLTAVAVLR